RLSESGRLWPASIHALSGDEIQVPWTSDAPPGHLSLLEERAGTFVADRSAAMSFLANGEPVAPGKASKDISGVVIKGLAAGDYSLQIAGECTIPIRITAGRVMQNWLLSPNRELEVREAEPLNIVRVQREPGFLVVQVANAGKFARLHV